MLTNTLQQAQQIGNGWKNVVFRNSEVEELAASRALICNRCKHKDRNKCGLCGCPLIAKQRSEKASCPIRRW